ncbi:PREDICTED: adenylate cyclase type 3-like [Priapulus caudatus]|uniref:adenylate cyclase n=1 Tax=Priapulus caudatus TaxID=37621 RepID=A0ABM1EKM6_PRICU|nr:PREDICTED: adenylate cyclase type 3-like [Priapulus caudatus]
MGVLMVLLSISLLIQISHVTKTVLMVVITVSQCLVNLLTVAAVYDEHDRNLIIKQASYVANVSLTTPPSPPPLPLLTTSPKLFVGTKYSVSFMMVVVVIAVLYLNRHIEIMSRKLFLRKTQVAEQRTVVESMRRKNQDLVFNLLPTHVAAHFLGAKKEDEELYAQSYDEVGVMFASVPNFSDFYNEDGANNQGIECLRFLNEVISDYDALLSEPMFHNITKIKTIGSTYMAASGMARSITAKCTDTTQVTERWQHLMELTEFAMAMKETLCTINAQSFNNFVLRIGINNGPILAGVIGARKPHYDIWGNTVNVASRMESTGQAGHIQVIESTMVILKQFGYMFEKRGIVTVKGKGEMLTYYLIGKQDVRATITALPNTPDIDIPTVTSYK